MSQELPSTTIVILGVSGDLSKRKLLPALAEICENSDIRAHLHILGISRRAVLASDVLPASASSLASQFETIQVDYQNIEEYEKLKAKLQEMGSEQVIFYFAVPPEAVLPMVRCLGESGMNKPRYKLLMEKPFGSDLKSATLLIIEIDKYFSEKQVYRIDHYLAKEMAQNIAVFLGSNVLFRDVWNNKFIEKIEIVAEESIGIEGRAHFYEQTGALRDVVQSHLLQLTALTLMEPCHDVFDISEMQRRRVAALKQLQVIPSLTVQGQYDTYKQEVDNPKSVTETFISLELKSSAPNWQGVPIKLITGKMLKEKLTEIRIFFKKTQAAQTNMLRLRIQPREAIELDLWVKKPGYEQSLQMLPLDFVYHQHFGRLPDAYEQVIVDAIRSRTNLFASSQEVIVSWEILESVLNYRPKPPLKIYKAGSAVDEILSVV